MQLCHWEGWSTMQAQLTPPQLVRPTRLHTFIPHPDSYLVHKPTWFSALNSQTVSFLDQIHPAFHYTETLVSFITKLKSPIAIVGASSRDFCIKTYFGPREHYLASTAQKRFHDETLTPGSAFRAHFQIGAANIWKSTDVCIHSFKRRGFDINIKSRFGMQYSLSPNCTLM